MPLSWNEIRDRALAFSNDWSGESSERAEAQTFWNAFFNLFGVSRRRIASFEKRVKEIDGKGGYIDLLWKGVLLIEHKSRGENLDRAYRQALDYFPGLKERDLPRFVLVSDFARFRLYDLDEGEQHEFAVQDLHKHVNRFAFIAGYQTHKIKEQDPVNIKAAELMGKLHDKLRDIGYTGHDLEVYLVRLLFCMFAEDTGIFERQQFRDYIEHRTGEDGTDLALHLDTLFYVLNTPQAQRLHNRDEQLSAFPFVNGKLFEERLRPASFDRAMRESLLQCCSLDWSRISPAIFGSLFQSIMDKDARRNLGAHYTSEKNILKLINPLFMDELRAEFEKAKKNSNNLFQFHKKLRTLTFLDPACGCGNFLVIAYRELRLLELEVLRATYRQGRQMLEIQTMIQLDVDQFYGIEIKEFPAQISQVAMWLVDHQMNTRVSQEFGMYFARIPLTSSANIVHGNALQMDWRDLVVPERLNYIMGNPPFIGKKEQNREQKAEVNSVFRGVKGNGVLDYVTCWYMKSADYIANTNIKVAFVSTKSIVQGEQVGVLWNEMYRHKCRIFFAHRVFKWTNEARGKAAVHCVIVGFSTQDISRKQIFDYETVTSNPSATKAQRINAYLFDAAEAIVLGVSNPICRQSPKMSYGSMGIDNGHLILTEEEKIDLLKKEPEAKKYVKPFVGADEYIKGNKRYCLWLKEAEPKEIRRLKYIKERVEKVRQFRLSSNRKETIALADTPTLFGEIRQPDDDYLIVPKVSSASREYIPIGYCPKHYIANGSSLTIASVNRYDFGVIMSKMHMAWMRYIGGRMKSDYQYSISLIYNNYPWPKTPTPKQTADIETKAQAVLDARAQFPDSTLADLYDPLTMPPLLLKTHQALDKAVDRTYRKTPFNNEAERVAFLFDLYQQYTAPLLPKKKTQRRKRAV